MWSSGRLNAEQLKTAPSNLKAVPGGPGSTADVLKPQVMISGPDPLCKMVALAFLELGKQALVMKLWLYRNTAQNGSSCSHDVQQIIGIDVVNCQMPPEISIWSKFDYLIGSWWCRQEDDIACRELNKIKKKTTNILRPTSTNKNLRKLQPTSFNQLVVTIFFCFCSVTEVWIPTWMRFFIQTGRKKRPQKRFVGQQTPKKIEMYIIVHIWWEFNWYFIAKKPKNI